MSVNLGSFNTATSRTHVGHQFTTHDGAGALVAPSAALVAADFRIYRAADGAAFSATQRSSTAGITVTSPFDSVVGFHDIDISLADNTDSGFYAAGYRYMVMLLPATTTVAGQTVGKVLAYFEIGPPPANVTQFGGTAGTFASGKPAVTVASTDVTGNVAADVQTIKTQAVTCAAGVTVPTVLASTTNITAATGVDVTKVAGTTVAAASAGYFPADVKQFGGAAGTFASGRPEVNATHFAGTISAGAAGYVGPDWSHIAAPTTVVALSGTTVGVATALTGTVTVATNNDKTGYGLADGAITDAKITAPAAAAGRPTGILGMVRRLFERTAPTNKRTRDRLTGVVTLYGTDGTTTLETKTQSTVTTVDQEV